MKINVNGGHTPSAPGAVGILNEVTEDRLVKNELIKQLRLRGHVVSDSTSNEHSPNADLVYQARAANASGAELAVSIHFNSFNGQATGTETWYYGNDGTGKNYAATVSARLAKTLGIRDRGAKGTTGFYWLNNTNMTALLIEVCFVDSAGDAAAYRSAGYKRVAASIADAISGTNNGVMGDVVEDNGARPIQLFTPNQNDAQKWVLEADGKNFRLRNVACGKYLDMADGKTTKQTKVRVFPKNGSNAQLWAFDPQAYERDTWNYIHPATNAAASLDVMDGALTNGAGIQLYDHNETNGQKWALVWAGAPRTYYIINLVSCKALDVINGGK